MLLAHAQAWARTKCACKISIDPWVIMFSRARNTRAPSVVTIASWMCRRIWLAVGRSFLYVSIVVSQQQAIAAESKASLKSCRFLWQAVTVLSLITLLRVSLQVAAVRMVVGVLASFTPMISLKLAPESRPPIQGRLCPCSRGNVAGHCLCVGQDSHRVPASALDSGRQSGEILL